MDELLGAVLASEAAPGQRVRYPGHVESDQAAERAAHGIPLAPHVEEQLDALARELGVDPPERMPQPAGTGA
jgi:LDH2 family malate/lactate/ureidoglycolate dehydrogenase